MKLLYQYKLNLVGMVHGWCPFKIVSDIPILIPFKMAAITKNRSFCNCIIAAFYKSK